MAYPPSVQNKLQLKHETRLDIQGKLEEAKSTFERAIKIWQAALEGGHPRVAAALNDWAKILQAQVRRTTTSLPKLYRILNLPKRQVKPIFELLIQRLFRKRLRSCLRTQQSGRVDKERGPDYREHCSQGFLHPRGMRVLTVEEKSSICASAVKFHSRICLVNTLP